MVAITSLFVLFLLLPLVALVWRAIDRASFWRYLDDRMVVEALKLSFTTTFFTMIVAFVVGTPAAYLLARWRFRGYRVIETLIDLPIVLPPVVAGVALLMAFGRRGLLGSELDAFGISLPFTTLGVVIAQVFVAVPFYVRSARAGFQTIPRDVEDAAQVDGATSWQVLLNVSVPAALPAITAGAVLCWSRALSEFGATLLFAGNLEGKTQTMPLAIMTAFESSLGSALAIAVILLLISSLILFLSRLVMSDADGFW